jgi:hypothetical protein
LIFLLELSAVQDILFNFRSRFGSLTHILFFIAARGEIFGAFFVREKIRFRLRNISRFRRADLRQTRRFAGKYGFIPKRRQGTSFAIPFKV